MNIENIEWMNSLLSETLDVNWFSISFFFLFKIISTLITRDKKIEELNFYRINENYKRNEKKASFNMLINPWLLDAKNKNAKQFILFFVFVFFWKTFCMTYLHQLKIIYFIFFAYCCRELCPSKLSIQLHIKIRTIHPVTIIVG